MMMHKMCAGHKAAWVLLVIGGLNWLLVGLLQKDLFGLLGMSMSSTLARVVYVLVGVSAVMMLGIGKCCMKDGMCKCGDGKCDHCVPNMPGGTKTM